MNASNWQHVGQALLLQAAVGLATGNWLAGACLGIGFFAGREHSQRESQITGGKPVGDLKWWQGFRGWSKEKRRDFYPAAAANLLLAWAAPHIIGWLA